MYILYVCTRVLHFVFNLKSFHVLRISTHIKILLRTHSSNKYPYQLNNQHSTNIPQIFTTTANVSGNKITAIKGQRRKGKNTEDRSIFPRG